MVVGRVDQVKGDAIISEIGWVKHKKGLEGLELVLEDLNKDRASNEKIGARYFDPMGWYPVEIQHQVLRSITDRFGDGDPEIIKEIGAYGIQKITTFTFIIRFMNVKKVANRMADTIQTLYRTTELNVIDKGEKCIQVSIKGFPNDEVYLRLLQGGIEQLLTFLHVEPFSVEATLDEGEDNICKCRYVLKWS